MHIELIDLLRCPNKHDDSHLVAVFHRVENRDVVDATLGCPVCGAEFTLLNGVASFGGKYSGERWPAPETEDADAAFRLAAYLDLATPGLTIVVAQHWAEALDELAEIAQPRVFVLTRQGDAHTRQSAAWLHISDVIPLASHSVDGIALDRDFAGAELIAEAQRVLKPGRRIVAPSDTTFPTGFRVLARDASWVIAERMPELIRLSR